jgi:hypothetical protein
MGSGIGKRAMEASLTALQRIQRLEGLEAIANENRLKMIEAFNGAIAMQSEKSSTIEGVVNAIVEILDKTTANLFASKTLTVDTGSVLEVLKNHLAIRHAAQVERDKAAIVALTKNGSLVATDVVAEDTLIVGEEVGPKSSGPGWVQMEFSNVREDFQPLLAGRHVGENVQLGEHIFTVKEIFQIVPAADVPTATVPPEAEPTEPNAMAGGYVAQEFSEAPDPAAAVVANAPTEVA